MRVAQELLLFSSEFHASNYVQERAVPRTALPETRGVIFRAMPADPAQVAHELFAVLREFDAQAVRQIWVEAPPEGPEWDGVRDRLLRAATR